MELSQQADYGLAVILHLSPEDAVSYSVDGTSPVSSMAGDFLRKIVQSLAKARVVVFLEDKGGGVILAHSAEDSTVSWWKIEEKFLETSGGTTIKNLIEGG